MSVIRSSKFGSASINLSQNSSNVTDLQGKIQASYLLEATVSETRPGGDVILATPQGLVRANTSIPLDEGNKVLVRLTKNNDSDIKAHIIGKVGSDSPFSKIDSFGVELLNKYILQNLNNSQGYSDPAGEFIARVSYVTANRNTLKYGNIKPGDEITIQVVSPKGIINNENTVAGEVLGNSHNNIILNSSIGMLNINAKSNLNVGDKILFRIANAPTASAQHSIKMGITKIINDIAENFGHLKAIFDEIQHLDQEEHYSRLLQLISTSDQHNITLARLLHNARHVPSSDVERWIEQDIVEPFEGSSKSSALQILGDDIAEINKLFVNLKITPQSNIWQTVEVPIPGTKDHAKMHVRREKKHLVEFILDIEHPALGRIIMQGTLTLANETSHFPLLDIQLKCSKALPSALQDIISSSFATHKSLSTMDGNISFEVMEPA